MKHGEQRSWSLAHRIVPPKKMSRGEKYRVVLDPFPLKLRANKSKGRYVVAKMNADVGSLLLEEIPNAFVVFKQFATEFCQHCLVRISNNQTQSSGLFGAKKTAAGVTCTDCRKQSFWCSERCKEEDLIHKVGCKYLIELPGIAGAASADYNLLRLVLHIVLRRHLEKDTQMPGTAFEFVADLLSHHKSFSASFTHSIEMAGMDFVNMFQGGPLETIHVDELVKLACRINSNSHAVHDPSREVNATIGVGIFPLVAMLNHSCTPNALFVSSESGKMHVRAIKPIKEGEEVCVSYVDLFAPKWDRQGSLLSSKFFWCECSRCHCEDKVDTDEWMDAVRCDSCSEGYIVRSSLCCTNCEKEMSKDELQCILDRVDLQNGMTLYKAGMFDSALLELSKIVSLAHSLLHPHHYLLLNAYVTLVSLNSRQNRFIEAASSCEQAIQQMILIAKDAKMSLYNAELANLYDKLADLYEILSEASKAGLLDSDTPSDEYLRKSKAHALESESIRNVIYG
jgi:hypothetical protein